MPAIASVPVRLAPEVLVATMKVTLPFPFPGPALRTATHQTLLSAVHAHVGPADTVLLPEPPSEVNDRVVGEIKVLQGAGAPCVTMKLVPAIVMVPVRVVVPVFAVKLNPTFPGPDPEAPLVTVIHGALLTADHEHPAAAVTELFPVPASLANVALVVERL